MLQALAELAACALGLTSAKKVLSIAAWAPARRVACIGRRVVAPSQGRVLLVPAAAQAAQLRGRLRKHSKGHLWPRLALESAAAFHASRRCGRFPGA